MERVREENEPGPSGIQRTPPIRRTPMERVREENEPGPSGIQRTPPIRRTPMERVREENEAGPSGTQRTPPILRTPAKRVRQEDEAGPSDNQRSLPVRRTPAKRGRQDDETGPSGTQNTPRVRRTPAKRGRQNDEAGPSDSRRPQNNPRQRPPKTPKNPRTPNTPKTPRTTRSQKSQRTPNTPKNQNKWKGPRTSGKPRTPNTPKTRRKQKWTKGMKNKKTGTTSKDGENNPKKRKRCRRGGKGKRRKIFVKKVGKRKAIYQLQRRPRLNAIRLKVTRTIERALVEAPKVPLIYHLFTERDSMGTPRAPLRQVLSALKISDYVKRSHLLKDTHMKSLTKFTTLFAIEEDEPYGGLYLKYWPIYNKQAATVYVDNLPEGCCDAQLMRLAECYGTVAELSVSKKIPRMIRPRTKKPKPKPDDPPAPRRNRRDPLEEKKPLIDVGSRPKAFGFIRFVDQDSATNMIRAFIVNDPTILHDKMEERRREEERAAALARRVNSDEIPDLLIPGDIEVLVPVVPREIPRPRPKYQELYMKKLIREMRFLKQRRKRRPWPMYVRLLRLKRRFRALRRIEYICLRRAGIIDPRAKVRYAERRRIMAGFPRQKARTSRSGRRPPPASPEDEEESTSNAPFPYYINRRKRKKNIKYLKKRAEKRKLEMEEKRKKRLKAALWAKKHRIPRGTIYVKRYVHGVRVTVKKRMRKKMSRKLAKHIPGGQVRRFFEDVQVLSLKKYLALKKEYKKLINQEKERHREEIEAPPAEADGPPMVVEEVIDPEFDVPDIDVPPGPAPPPNNEPFFDFQI
ncbi:hypothetical protein CRE_07908 [Caenorhabditis remanei]|uniref:RRM domain-containing protein n=1 Tax=Caenorhabditis remanei TaxID=31234 RepID=E3NPB0_CAERE|nr:hypothetical protein CRE_07908 [Caenorhabditis remanei]